MGRVPDAIVFAGRHLPAAIPGSDLVLCGECGLRFKFPPLEKAVLDELYNGAAGDTWQAAAEVRVDWLLAAKHLARGNGGDILDLGCFDGRFLETLGAGWVKHGIEISEWGALKATEKGITIVGRDFSILRSHPGRFAAITAFDVIEHVHNPDIFLTECWHALRPGGQLLIATGDASSLPWKLHGERNLYCICPEHLVFLTPTWIVAAAKRHYFTVARLQRYRRASDSVVRTGRDFLANLLFRVSPSLVAALAGLGAGQSRTAVTREHPPLWPSARDHMFVVLSKDVQ